jgi:CBS domain-containing protein
VNATVRDVMTRRVVSVREDASFKEMADMLRRTRISAFPVIDRANRVIGLVSAADLLVKEAVQATGTSLVAALRHVREEDKAKGVTAADLMTRPAITIGPDAAVTEAARIMYDRRIKRLPVVDAAGRLLGIVSRTDVLAVFSRPDDEIRDEIVHQALPAAVISKPRGVRGGGARWHRDHLGRAAQRAGRSRSSRCGSSCPGCCRRARSVQLRLR